MLVLSANVIGVEVLFIIWVNHLHMYAGSFRWVRNMCLHAEHIKCDRSW
jgi:hypothetical protein